MRERIVKEQRKVANDACGRAHTERTNLLGACCASVRFGLTACDCVRCMRAMVSKSDLTHAGRMNSLGLMGVPDSYRPNKSMRNTLESDERSRVDSFYHS